MIWRRNLKPYFLRAKRENCLLLLHVAVGVGRGEKHEKEKREVEKEH